MKNIFKNSLKIAAVLVASSITSMAFAENYTCPTLTASDVQALIAMPAQTTLGGMYYYWEMDKIIDNQKYTIFVGDLAGKDASEAADRAKKILLTGEESFSAVLLEDGSCLYKEVKNPSSYISDYPSDVARVMLEAKPSLKDETPPQVQKFLMK